MPKKLITLVSYLLIQIFLPRLEASNRRHITTLEGMSNMSVLSLMQDNDGYVWAATCDGVNIIGNGTVTVLGPGNDGRSELSGNLVENVSQDSRGIIWAHTNYGLDRFDISAGKVDYFRNINGGYADAVAPCGDVAVVTSADSLLFCGKDSGTFVNLGLSPLPQRALKRLWLDDSGNLTAVGWEGLFTANIRKGRNPIFRKLLDRRVRHADISDGVLYYVTENFDLHAFGLTDHKDRKLFALPESVKKRGDVSAVVRDGDSYVLGFKTQGAVRIRVVEGVPEVDPFDIGCGVFDIMKDRNQEILWFGTDGDGIYYYIKDSYEFHSQNMAGSGGRIAKPVRAILPDGRGNLWVGTKGDGLYCFRNYVPGGDNRDVVRYTSSDSPLNDNDVYALARSSRPLMWVGTQGHGLCYYSFTDNSLHRLELPMAERLQSVHSIHETWNGTLYVATVGEGVFSIRLGGSLSSPVAMEVHPVIYDASHPDANAFFCAVPQGRSAMWFGNRGMGAYYYNTESGVSRNLDFGSLMPVANDVFDIFVPRADSDTVYCATSMGLILINGIRDGKFTFEGVKGSDAGRVHTLHAILPCEGGMMASTNFGLVKYSLPSLSFVSYLSGTDFTVMQFSDAAACRDELTGRLFFGGANGFVCAVPAGDRIAKYAPEIKLRFITVGNKTVPLDDIIDDKGRIVLGYNDKNFSLGFCALDYIDGANYIYRYRLRGISDQWMETGNGEIPFTNMRPGKYTLEISYDSGSGWSEPVAREIVVRPPFYASPLAMAIYLLLAIGGVVCLLLLTVRFQRRKRERIVRQMEQKGKEDVYEAKLRFFTNVTHELFTPLTLINGACERMLTEKTVEKDNRRLTAAIQRNSQRLTELIQELIEFRKIDTEYRKPEVEIVDVGTLTKDLCDNFVILAERNDINFKVDADSGMEWPTDRSGYTMIVNNLVSNAFKYTKREGEIRVSVAVDSEKDQLLLSVSNTGEGIAPEDIGKIFDRYKVLERFERLSATGTIRRNGLGLAVCEGLVRLLGGSISVESTRGEWTRFDVCLPRIEVTVNDGSVATQDPCNLSGIGSIPEEGDGHDERAPLQTGDAGNPLVYVIDDDKDILWFISESLKDTYNVITFANAADACVAMKTTWPSVIICDLIMEGMSGLDFVKKIKEDKSTLHIPVVQLSSLHSEEDKIRSLDAGADIYVTKPFKVEYLRTVVARLIKRKENLKEYFGSSLSSFDKVDGQLLHDDDREFLGKVMDVIEKNITNPDLSTAMVAEELGLSLRNLYRRLEGLTDSKPASIIRDVRMRMAQDMLVHTSLSIDEVLYKCGFNNRGTFFKLFQQRFGCTPKQYRAQSLSNLRSTGSTSDSITS